MAAKSFSVSGLERKLKDLTSTLQSIQGISQWLVQHRKHAKTIVGLWFREVQRATTSKKLTLLYLANDVIQNCKKKGQEYRNEFSRALPRAFQLFAKEKDSAMLTSVYRVLDVWEERRVFESSTLVKFRSSLSSGAGNLNRRTKSESDAKRKSSFMEEEVSFLKSPPPSDDPPNDLKPPEAEELLKKMASIDGSNSSVQDVATRQKIASFPSDLYDPDILSKLTDKESGEKLMGQLEEALKVLSAYNKTLEEEAEQRRDNSKLLDVFTWQQQRLLHQAIVNQKEYQGKLKRCSQVRETLRSHIASLPDLSSFTSMTGPKTKGLAPLPSVGDLFS